MKENFDIILNAILKHEGGFTDDQKDKGNSIGDGYGNKGSTNLGVTSKVWAEFTKKPAPIEVMKKLTIDDMASLFKKNYYDAVSGDDLPSGVDLAVVDFAYNSGPGRAAKTIQKICGCKRDGAIGPKTLTMINRQSSKYLVDKLSDERQEFVENIRGGKDFERFGRGWTKRIEDVREQGLKLTSDS